MLVISPDGKVRAAVFDRISLTEPELRPLVIEPAMVPIIRDLTLAIAHYPLAVLAAVFHATGPDAVLCATLAIRALLAIAPEDYGSAFTRGRREGIEQGFHLGLEQGLAQMRTTLRNILAARGLVMNPLLLARVAACESIDELSSMLVRATTIDSADQLFSD